MSQPQKNQEWARRQPTFDETRHLNRVIVIGILGDAVCYAGITPEPTPVYAGTIAWFQSVYIATETTHLPEILPGTKGGFPFTADIATALKRMDDICALTGCESPRHYNIHDPGRGGHTFVEQPPAAPEPPTPTRKLVRTFPCPFCRFIFTVDAMLTAIIVPADQNQGLTVTATFMNTMASMPMVRMQAKREPSGSVVIEWVHACPMAQ
jgi:hypothetical protein